MSGMKSDATNMDSFREWLAGLVIGLLTIKPQLGVLIPLALIAGRYWRAIAGAVLSSALLAALAYALFGIETWRAFLAARTRRRRAG